MKRKYLKDLGLSNELIDQIMEEHGHTVESIKENITEKKDKEIEKLIAEKDREVNKISLELNKVIQAKENLEKNPNSDEIEKKLKGLETKHAKELEDIRLEKERLTKELEIKETEATNAKAERANDIKKTALRSALVADGLPKQLIDLVESKFDVSKLEVDGDKVKDWDNVSKPVKEAYPDVFKVVTQAGFIPNTPPQSQNNQTVYTVDQIKAMTPQEINDNWDKGVKQALESKN